MLFPGRISRYLQRGSAGTAQVPLCLRVAPKLGFRPWPGPRDASRSPVEEAVLSVSADGPVTSHPAAAPNPGQGGSGKTHQAGGSVGSPSFERELLAWLEMALTAQASVCRLSGERAPCTPCAWLPAPLSRRGGMALESPSAHGPPTSPLHPAPSCCSAFPGSLSPEAVSAPGRAGQVVCPRADQPLRSPHSPAINPQGQKSSTHPSGDAFILLL